MVDLKLLLLISYLLPGHESSTINRMFEYWQPNDIYVILNSTTAGEDIIGAMSYPRYLSLRDDFSTFIPGHRMCAFPDNFVLVLLIDECCRSVKPILTNQLSQKVIVKRSKVVIISSDVQESFAEGMFRDLWQMGLLNVFLLHKSSIYSFNPFSGNFVIKNPSSEFLHLISIDRASNFHGKTINVPMIPMYPGAQTIVWHNRTIFVGELYYTLRPIGEFFNATIRTYSLKTIDYGFEYFRNATTSVVSAGVGEELVMGRGDFSIMTRSYGVSNYFDFLSPLYTRECNLLTPKAGRIPQYMIVVSVALSWVGVLSFSVLIGIVVFTAIAKWVLRTDINLIRFSFELGSVYIGQSFSFPIQTLSMRLTIACWLLVCVSLGTLFNAEIVTSFLKPQWLSDIDLPFKALMGDGFNVYAFRDLVFYLKGNSKHLFSSEEAFQMLMNKLRGVPREEFFYRMMHPNGKDMFLAIANADHFVEKTKYLTDQTYSYHKTMPIFRSLVANIVPRGSIIYNHLNDFYYRIFEAGLSQHWTTLELLYELKFDSNNETQEKSLTIKDLYSAFLVLVLGHALAAAVFIVEQFVAHSRKRPSFRHKAIDMEQVVK